MIRLQNTAFTSALVLISSFYASVDLLAKSSDKENTVRLPLPSTEEIKKLPPDGGPEFNRLIHETSPYLRQHARNAVDWYPWGEEAFAKAFEENKPIFLSVGYSSCHWCHVMEHESFEHQSVADVLNEKYVSVKVDREERPDLDQIYMNATQMMTGRGGWPNSLWLDAKGRPFYCGTYFPREDQGGRPGFISMLNGLHDAWVNKRDEIDQQAAIFQTNLQKMGYTKKVAAENPMNKESAKTLVATWGQRFDATEGGFGGAPKFPPHNALSFLLDQYAVTPSEEIRSMLELTFDKMALGGIHDHVGGGFHRYATDGIWFLPHFEKMLYDNAQLLSSYTQAYKLLGHERYKQVAEGIADWIIRDMSDPAGGFYSAYDADSEGEEGKYYLWDQQEILSILGKENGTAINRRFQCSNEGNFYDEASGHKNGKSILHLKSFISDQDDYEQARANLIALRKERDTRIHPELDDKVICSWNGLTIAALAEAGEIFKREDYLAAANKAADFIMSNMQIEGRLNRTYRAGTAQLNGYLDDYAFLIHGLLNLHSVSGDPLRLKQATILLASAQQHYGDEQGGFFFTSDDHEELLARTKDPFDNAVPSGNGYMAKNLVRMYILSSEEKYATWAQKSFQFFEGLIQSAPTAASSFMEAWEKWLAVIDQQNTEKEAGNEARVAIKFPVTISAQPTAQDDIMTINLKFEIEEGWHINARDPGLDYLIPLDIKVKDHKKWSALPIAYSQGHAYEVKGMDSSIQVYSGQFTTPIILQANKESAEEPLQITVSFQACDHEKCLAPEILSLKVEMQD